MNVLFFSFHLPLKTSNSVFFSSNFPCLKLTINCFFSIFSSSKYTSKGKNVASAISPYELSGTFLIGASTASGYLTTVSTRFPQKSIEDILNQCFFSSLLLINANSPTYLFANSCNANEHPTAPNADADANNICVVALTFSMFSPAPPKNNTIGVDTAPMENSCMSLNRTTNRNSFTCGPL